MTKHDDNLLPVSMPRSSIRVKNFDYTLMYIGFMLFIKKKDTSISSKSLFLPFDSLINFILCWSESKID